MDFQEHFLEDSVRIFRETPKGKREQVGLPGQRAVSIEKSYGRVPFIKRTAPSHLIKVNLEGDGPQQYPVGFFFNEIVRNSAFNLILSAPAGSDVNLPFKEFFKTPTLPVQRIQAIVNRNPLSNHLRNYLRKYQVEKEVAIDQFLVEYRYRAKDQHDRNFFNRIAIHEILSDRYPIGLDLAATAGTLALVLPIPKNASNAGVHPVMYYEYALKNLMR